MINPKNTRIGRPRLPPGQVRAWLSCRVEPETLASLKKLTGKHQLANVGRLLDYIVKNNILK